MLFRSVRHQNLVRWIAIPPAALIAAFIAFNLFTPFRLMQEGIWPPGWGLAGDIGSLVVDALLMLAPLIVVMVFAAWLTAPHSKILTVKITGSVLGAGCGAFALLQVGVQHWHGAMVMGFGAAAAVITAFFIVRYERQEALRAAQGAADGEGGETHADGSSDKAS